MRCVFDAAILDAVRPVVLFSTHHEETTDEPE